MAHSQFIIPTDDQFMDILHITPESRGEYGRGMTISTTDGFEIDLTVDLVVGQAVTLIVRRDGADVIVIVREGATLMRLWGAAPEIVIEFGTDDTIGRLEVTLVPSLHVSETVLLG